MSFLNVIDQPIAVKLMQSAIRRNRVPSAMLLWGPGGVGKALAGLEMACAVNCEQQTDDACGTCHQCRKILHGTHPDVKFIKPTGKTRIFKIEVVEMMTEMTSYRPFEGRYRVFILDDVERMSVAAQNHFLKTLEEPISNTLFILVTESPNQLLPTIRSRCQKIRFGVLKTETVASLLIKHRNVEPQKAHALAAISQGQMTRALNLVDTDKRGMVLGIMEALRNGHDPLAVSASFMEGLKEKQDLLRVEIESQEVQEDVDASRDNKKEQDEALEAYVQLVIRRDLMEYLYLFKTLCRDEMVYAETNDVRHVFNQDIVAQFRNSNISTYEKKLNAIEKSWRYVERNLNIGRVFRDLFFVLAA